MMIVTGKVTRLIPDKGFGFIAAQDGTEYFFHQSALARRDWETLQEGTSVTFEATEGPKGPRAEHVTCT